MKYDHAVVYGGKFYRAGEEVPMPIKEEAKKEVKEEVKKNSKKAASVEIEKDTNTAKAKEEAVKEKEEAKN